ncbi:MAG: hypothetical protein CBC42_02295 [Betaproteobacteria bacterium TMED82]|nr:MAG: hypothetical protein CBC42_02295 [Betaproteobacteria bacterium TMED82]|tara:strand:- start:30709 stop:31596 length:888 start_codon:yes stop_codon:yes gene_type:complete
MDLTLKIISFIFGILGYFPISILRLFGFGLGWVFWVVSPKYRKKIRENWETAIMSEVKPGMNKASFPLAVGNAGLLISELPKIWSNKKPTVAIKMNGLDKVADLLKKGKGLICLTPHLGAFELAPRLYSEHFPITVLYKPPKNKLLRKLLLHLRHNSKINFVISDYSGVKELLKALRRGESVGILPDQVPFLNAGVWAPFFGKAAYTNLLAIRLATITRAPIVWVTCERRMSGWTLNFQEWLQFEEIKKTVSETVELSTLMNKYVEGLVCSDPNHYLWSYDRYKKPKVRENFNEI